MKLKLTFISNYINHHQIPFCKALYERLSDDFAFIQTEPMEEERVRMGWAVDAAAIPYVHLAYQEAELCHRLVDDCDLLLAGWMEDPGWILKRLSDGRPAFRISERIYREGQWKAVSPRGLAAKYREHIRFRKKPVYLLCAGAYVASDFALIHAYPGKRLRFGYFPETADGDMQERKGKDGPVQILWAGRLMPLKHPEYALRLSADLKERGISFHLHLVGGGEMEEDIRGEVRKRGLSDVVSLYGFLPPEKVREKMEESHIFLFTSDHLEGWGAVVNEAMNSGCAVVGSDRAGAVPFLIRQGENGMIYHKGNYEEFREEVIFLLEHPDARKRMGEEAAKTIRQEWNADEAAKRVLAFYENLKENRIELPKEGPLSPAPVIRP